MKEKVKNTIIKYNLIESGDRLVLGVSGGPDSLSMLRILYELKDELGFDIRVAHVNHMLRKEAKEEEKFVRDFCNNLGIEFYYLRADVETIAKLKKQGTEEVGRNIRYEYFNKIAHETKSNKIAIAHNKNDVAETIIMNLLRGSGINGLKGIEPKNEQYIRPLIECTRDEIEDYCKVNNLNPRIDKSNFDNTYTRNRIRNIVIPYIKEEFNPNIIETLDRLSSIAREETEYVDLLVKDKFNLLLESETEKEIILNIREFNKEDRFIQKKVIMFAIQKLFGTTKGVEKIHLEDVVDMINKNIGNKYLTPNKNTKIVIKNKQIYIQRLN